MKTEEQKMKNRGGVTDGMQQHKNCLYIKFPAIPENERMARMVTAVFLTDMNPNLEELDDVKTAVSEAVTNCIIHAYDKEAGKESSVELELKREGQLLSVTITDKGKGIKDINRAMEPLFTTRPEDDRSGMGFSFMEAFMHELIVESVLGKGTTVKMKKIIGRTDS